MRGLGPFLRDAWRLALPFFRSEQKWSARGLLAAIVALNLLLVAINVQLSYWNRAFYDALQAKDLASFWDLLLLWRNNDKGFTPGFCVLAGFFILIAIYRTYLSQWLRIRWRGWMTERLLADWLSERAYWHIALKAGSAGGHGTDNPDQRIADDLKDFADETLALGLGLLSSTVTLFSFVTILWTLSGPITLLGLSIPGYMVWVALIYAAAGTALSHLIGQPLAALNFRQQKVEADFRFGLARMRENLEGIALYSGEAQEKRAATGRFAAVIANWRQIMDRTKMLNAFTAGFDQIAVVFPLIVAAPRYFAGEIALGGLTQTTGAFRSVENAMAFFVHAYSTIATWRATVERLTAFRMAIEAARAAPPGVHIAAGTDGDYRLDGLSLALPDGRKLLDSQSLALKSGEWVAVGGRSGAGKSTIFRAFAGLWPFGTGAIVRPAGTSLFLPQRPYIPLGTLRRAVAYPADPADFTDAELREALDAVGLGQLRDALDQDEPWAQRLSGGELQRLAVARALLARPDWLFLDEATASLDPQSEAELYALIRARLPETTVISIAHRPSVAALHDRRLTLEPEAAGGSLRPA
ncbi:MAG: ABC transporter ATP-binding protein/permease [Alphaproteobacteria bacterium]|nr:ABC transporter ATP-binding protein/permease [Alphaproteobacteria bacterium]